jgi:hypothetical protein
MVKAADFLVIKILEEKIRLEKEGKNPRIVLLSEKKHNLLQNEWIESIRSLPWGDSLACELERRAALKSNMFLGDGRILNLWVIRVDTIEGFEVR